jgi:ubiquinone/menaquinone biosynthesis C-methylase UbiE
MIQADLERSQTRLQQIQAEMGRSQHQFKQESQAATQTNLSSQLSSQPLTTTAASKPGIAASTSTNASILNYGSGLTDQEWLEVLIKSVEHKFVNGIELPGFPPDEFQRNSVGSSGEHPLREAFNFYCEIKRYMASLGRTLTPNSRLLDFGCGWGRIIRFFLKDVVAENLYGIDVDPQMMDICIQTVRHGNYSLVRPLPPSGLAENSLDIVYAYSVFSHLGESAHIKWVEEFSRILKPGGILLVTTHSRSFIEFCRSLRGQEHTFYWYKLLANSFLDTEAALADYDSGKFLYSPTSGGEVRDASFYGEAVISPGYVKREWNKYLRFYDFVDDPARCPQAIIVMQKPV